MSDTVLERPVEMFQALFAEHDATTRALDVLRASIRSSIQSVLDAQTDDIFTRHPQPV